MKTRKTSKKDNEDMYFHKEVCYTLDEIESAIKQKKMMLKGNMENFKEFKDKWISGIIIKFPYSRISNVFEILLHYRSIVLKKVKEEIIKIGLENYTAKLNGNINMEVNFIPVFWRGKHYLKFCVLSYESTIPL